MALLDEIRRYWDDDAATYDDAPQHRPRSPMVQAAWTAALESALPRAPARVLDCGAGTGFLTLIAARLGHAVTALDLSPAMVDRLKARARLEGLEVDTMVGSATEPPGDGASYDVVMERHLLWTLPDPGAALRAWRGAVGASATLVLVESLWGAVDPLERRRATLRRALHRVRALPPEHHAEYEQGMRQSLPLGTGTHPSRLIELVTDSGWQVPTLRRLADVEWAERTELPLPERLLGVPPRFVVTGRS